MSLDMTPQTGKAVSLFAPAHRATLCRWFPRVNRQIQSPSGHLYVFKTVQPRTTRNTRKQNRVSRVSCISRFSCFRSAAVSQTSRSNVILLRLTLRAQPRSGARQLQPPPGIDSFSKRFNRQPRELRESKFRFRVFRVFRGSPAFGARLCRRPAAAMSHRCG